MAPGNHCSATGLVKLSEKCLSPCQNLVGWAEPNSLLSFWDVWLSRGLTAGQGYPEDLELRIPTMRAWELVFSLSPNPQRLFKGQGRSCAVTDVRLAHNIPSASPLPKAWSEDGVPALHLVPSHLSPSFLQTVSVPLYTFLTSIAYLWVLMNNNR